MSLNRLLLGALVSMAAFGLSSTSAMAGSFSVSPLRVEFGPQQKTGALTIKSRQDSEVVVEAQVMLWEQVDGEDRLTPTRDVLISPVVFKLPPDGSQLVRVALQRAADPKRELSYRLILTEVAQQSDPDFTGLNVALRISLPIFVTPSTTSAGQLEWSIVRADSDMLRVTARNVGNAHARVLNFSVAPPASSNDASVQSVAAYILPDQAKTWALDLQQQDGTSGVDLRRLRVKGATEAGDFELELSPIDG
jgi:fimbrial chaperone protein